MLNIFQPVWKKKSPEQNGKVTPEDMYDDITPDLAPHAGSTKIQMDDEEDDDDEDEADDPPRFVRAILNLEKSAGRVYRRHDAAIKTILLCILAVGYAAYFGYAMWYNIEGEDSIRLLWITCVVVFFCIVKLIVDTCGNRIFSWCASPVVDFISRRFTFFKW